MNPADETGSAGQLMSLADEPGSAGQLMSLADETRSAGQLMSPVQAVSGSAPCGPEARAPAVPSAGR